MNPLYHNGYGDIRNWCQDETATRFQWGIPDAASAMVREKKWFASPCVRCLGAVLKLAVCPASLTLFILVHQHGEPEGSAEFVRSVRYTIGLTRADGTVEEVARNRRFPEEPRTWGSVTMMPGQIIQSLTSGVGELTITCSVRRFGLPFAESTAVLREHFKNLLISGDHYDFVIKVGGKQYWAHKCVLQARSPVFAAMFRNDMAESADNSVAIDDCDPEAFGEFLRFVYCGEADISSAGRALELYRAGDKYDFPGLKEICVEFLKGSLAATTVLDVMGFAVSRDEEELRREAVAYFSKNLEEIMLTAEWQRFLERDPLRANEICLKAVRCLKTSWNK